MSPSARTLLLLSTATLACSAAAREVPPVLPTSPTSIDRAMLFRSFVQDDPSCAVGVQDGEVVLPSPASCPDAFAWGQLASAITGEFWNWGIDQTVWPATPWAQCVDGQTEQCCPADFPSNPTSDLLDHCPYSRDALDPIPALPATPNSDPSGVVLSHRGAHKKTVVERQDPGRLIRDVELELVFRNAPMIDYIFAQDLYNKEGLGARVRAANSAVKDGNIAAAHALEVRLPTDAMMVKADFIHQDIMEAQGLISDHDRDRSTPPNHPTHPYLTIYLTNETDESKSGYYYMVAMTNASKALPNWHWYAIEHVANLGRCDYIGCNDSFGYTANAEQPDGSNFGGHFIPPKQEMQNDQAVTDTGNPNDPIFLVGKPYLTKETGEVITAELSALFGALNIGSDDVDRDPKTISPSDPQWKNYRLKGTQSAFTTSHGVPTGTGATVTEGGFVNSASCLTCHSQASVDEEGNPGVGGSVGSTWRPNLFGFSQVEMGAPELSWFFYPGTNSPYAAVQIDFIWGVLVAQCIETSEADPTVCASYPDAPTIQK